MAEHEAEGIWTTPYERVSTGLAGEGHLKVSNVPGQALTGAEDTGAFPTGGSPHWI